MRDALAAPARMVLLSPTEMVDCLDLARRFVWRLENGDMLLRHCLRIDLFLVSFQARIDRGLVDLPANPAEPPPILCQLNRSTKPG
jgi:hypothetical protein